MLKLLHDADEGQSEPAAPRASIFDRLGWPPPDPSTLEAIGRGEYPPRRPGGIDPRTARAIARAKILTREEHERAQEKYWEYERRNAERAAAKEASAAAVAAIRTAEAQPRARQRQSRRRGGRRSARAPASDGESGGSDPPCSVVRAGVAS